jgi:hypothetical protein
MLRRTLLVVAVLLPTTIGTLAGGTIAATAAPNVTHTSCKLGGAVTFKPGLTFTAQAVTDTVAGTLKSCSGGGVKSATVTGVLKSSKQTCSSGTAAGALTVKWTTVKNTAKTSIASMKLKPGTKSLTFVLSGTVTSGLFKGDTVSGSGSVSPVTGNCLFSPLKKATISGSLKS